MSFFCKRCFPAWRRSSVETSRISQELTATTQFEDLESQLVEEPAASWSFSSGVLLPMRQETAFRSSQLLPMDQLFPFGVQHWTTLSFNRPWDRLCDPANLAVDLEPWVAVLPSALVIVEGALIDG